ncbi:hypothetical protein [Clostridium celatum]|uniref:hypothetical protein n=1 Tax=Clostridium celatum TaxID=36834 RepID=UPI00319E67AE
MNNFKIEDEVCLLKRLYNDIDFYKIGLKEILLYLDTRSEVVQRFKYNTNELYKYVQIGEILEDIKKNYIEHESVCNADGEIVDFKKVYQVRAERVIFDTQMFLIELEDDEHVENGYINQIKDELAKYESKNIFTELLLLEELLLSVNSEKLLIYDRSNDFIKRLNKFNLLDEVSKYSALNDFCYDNIERNTFVDELIKIYNDYHGAEVIVNINGVEGMTLFSRWDTEHLRVILEEDSELYFKIINTLNSLQQLNSDLLNVNFVKKQIDIINKLQIILNKLD